jgi:predicted membrane channel-forming protein YqfA (hemolysin III family)
LFGKRHADHVGILALWLARALCEGFVLLYCHRGCWLLWACVSLVVFAAATQHVVSSGSTKLFLPLYAYIHLPLAFAAVLDPAFFKATDPPGLGDALRGAVRLTLTGSACGVVGYVVMVAKVPERWSAEGRFDTWGHSHQWWHVLTIAGPVLCLEAGRLLLAARLQHACPA